MPISQDAAFAHLEQHLDRTWNAITRAGVRCSRQSELPVFVPRTAANTLNDLAFDEMVAAFDEIAGAQPREDRMNNMRFISIDDVILLWLKKVDSQRVKSNLMLTDHAVDLLDEQAAFEFMPHASLIVVGYWFDMETWRLRRVSFSPPSRSRPAWYFDIEPGDAGVIEMRPAGGEVPPTQTASGLRITRGPVQRQL